MNPQATMTPEQKEFLIEEALKTEAGRLALASSMANPIRLTLDYQGIGRKLLVVDPLPQGALPVYDKDVKIPVVVVSKRGSAPDSIVEGERITVGTWEIVSYPQVRFSQVKERRYNLIDRAQQRAKLDLMAEEDRNVFNAIDRSSNLLNPETTVANQLTRDALVSGLSEVGKWDLVPAKFCMNFSEYSDLMKFGRDQFDPVTQREVLQTGLVGHLWTLDILVSKVVPRGTIWVIAEPEFTGVIPIRQDVNVIPADKPERLRLGWVVYEELGIAVVNPRAVSRINVTGKPTFVPF
jgi:hypothetical protein